MKPTRAKRKLPDTRPGDNRLFMLAKHYYGHFIPYYPQNPCVDFLPGFRVKFSAACLKQMVKLRTVEKTAVCVAKI